jgi:hypothetical protein
MSGSLSSSAWLQTGQGAPAAPQPHSRRPSHGFSVWISQTHRLLSHREQNFIAGSYARPRGNQPKSLRL